MAGPWRSATRSGAPARSSRRQSCARWNVVTRATDWLRCVWAVAWVPPAFSSAPPKWVQLQRRVFDCPSGGRKGLAVVRPRREGLPKEFLQEGLLALSDPTPELWKENSEEHEAQRHDYPDPSI